MKPHKPELDAIRQVMLTPLEEFITAKDDNGKRTQEQLQELAQVRMFTRAIEAVDEARGGRTTHTVILRHGTASVFYTAFGPYATENQARKDLDEVLLRRQQPTGYAIVPTRNKAGLSELIAATDAPPPVKGDWAEVEKDKAARKNGWKGTKHRDRQQYLPEALR